MKTENSERKRITEVRAPKAIIDAIAEQPRLFRALALLVGPIETEAIEAGGFPFATWANAGAAAILTDRGPYLRSVTRQYLLTRTTPEELETARQDCIRIIDQSVALWGDRIHPDLRSARAKNCAAVGYQSQLIEDVSWLCKLYRRQNQPYHLVLLLSKTNLDAAELPAAAREIALWAYEQTNWRPEKR